MDNQIEVNRQSSEDAETARLKRDADAVNAAYDAWDAYKKRKGAAKTGIGIEELLLHADGDEDLFRALMTGTNVFIWGDVGRGKTYLATCALARAHECGYSVVRVNEAALNSALKDMFGDTGKVTAEKNRLMRPHVLMLDDMGKAQSTDWWSQTVYEIIDTRWQRGLATCVTSQYDGRELCARLGRGMDCAAALYSRLFGGCKIIHLEGPDRRREVSAK